jgi:superfamily II DNA or RNA helicase
MRFKIISPTKAYVIDATPLDIESLTKSLSYINTAFKHQAKRHYDNKWLRNKNKDAWEKKLAELKTRINNCLLFHDGATHWIRPGSLSHLNIPKSLIDNEIIYPTPKKVPWAKPLPFDLYDYQEMSVEKLIQVKHGNVELCTGAGKSAIILQICRETGFRTCIIAPSQSIFNELLEKFEHHLGKDKVGAYGDGKKKIGKRFTVCIGDSLANLKPGTEEWNFFAGMDMMIVDESHTWGADTLEDICHGVLQSVPYRMFMSGTQTRGDGAERLLQSIIGQTVHTLTTKEAIAGGYICDHDFTIVDIESSNPNQQSGDILEMKRIHFLRNRNIAAFIAKLANASAMANNHQTLILVEELSQIAMLIPLLKVPYAYAHSESSKVKLAELELTSKILLEKVDRADSVEKFNKSEAKVLIGTSCIATGTNIFPTHNCVNWVGGSSEIKTKQGAVGRAVRKGESNPWAKNCAPKAKSRIWDFNVHDQFVLGKMLADRVLCYRDSGTEIKRIKLK